MDAERFERLSRAVAGSRTRRAAVGAVAAAVAVSLGIAKAPEAEAGIPIVSCKIPGQICQSDKACCTGKCNKGICACFGKRHSCWQPAEGALCCSGRCRAGKCK